jgi:hypothetical protein
VVGPPYDGYKILLKDKISSAKDSQDRHENKPTAALNPRFTPLYT